MDSNTVADRLREFGQEKYGNMTQFAGALGMSPQALSPYLNGRRNPGKRMLAKLEQLGANPGYISGEGEGGSAPAASAAPAAAAPAKKRRGRKPKAKPAAEAAPKKAKAPAAKKAKAKTKAKAKPAAAAKPAAEAAPKKAKGRPGRKKGSTAVKAAPKKRRGRQPKAAVAATSAVSAAEMQLLEYLRKIGLASVDSVVNLLESIKTVSDEDYMKKFRRAKPRKIVK